mmetsp:Transcript_57253/g.177950  ORF Transcript_57253/g.177950 Transcript_57253/m.177950 type:complete len:104 (-) Transcript_57253:3-314(-)
MQTGRGWSALHYAVAHGHAEVCHVLLDSPRFSATGAVDCMGRTALHTASEAGHGQVRRVLLADARLAALAWAEDFGDCTASDLAETRCSGPSATGHGETQLRR